MHVAHSRSAASIDLFGITIERMPGDETTTLLVNVHGWPTRDEFVYRHQLRRDLLHRAAAGYDGQDRLLHHDWCELETAVALYLATGGPAGLRGGTGMTWPSRR
jgi:hypothetical protein